MKVVVQRECKFYCVMLNKIRYIHFHWLIYYWKRSWHEVTRTFLEWACVRFCHEPQEQTASEMTGLILIRLPHPTFTCCKSVKTARQACNISSGWTSTVIPQYIIWLNSKAEAACGAKKIHVQPYYHHYLLAKMLFKLDLKDNISISQYSQCGWQ